MMYAKDIGTRGAPGRRHQRLAVFALLGIIAGSCLVWTTHLSASNVVDDTPPFLSEGVAPNLVVTVDFSDSMDWGFLPDQSVFTSNPSPSDLKDGYRSWYTSPDVNALYFVPSDYPDPPEYTPGREADGTPKPDASYTAATVYPYGNPSNCDPTPIDLSKDFVPLIEDRFNCLREYVPELPGAAYYHKYDPDKRCKKNDVPGAGEYEFANCEDDEVCAYSCGEAFGDKRTAEMPDSCFERIPILDEEEQKRFANWYTYYRTRLLVVQTVLSRAMLTLNDGVRVSFQDVSDSSGFKPGTTAFDALDDAFDDYANNKGAFYNWLFNNQTTNGTKLVAAQIRAGEFVSQGSAALDDPDLGATDNMCGVKCRNNFHLMLTDGAWSDRWTDSSLPETIDGTAEWLKTNQDGGEVYTFVDSPFGVDSYSPADPNAALFADENVGMLADAVFYYWVRDLDGDATNNQVPPIITDPAEGKDKFDAVNFWNPNNDPATWQHLTFFGVGFGVDGAVERELDADGQLTGRYGSYDAGGTMYLDGDGFPSCSAVPPYVWDDEHSSFWGPKRLGSGCTAVGYHNVAKWYGDLIPDDAKIDDLFHASLNGRGGYYDASNPDSLLTAFTGILETVSAIAEQDVSSASVAINGSGNLSDDTRIFQAVSDSETWSGQVRSYQVSRGYGDERPACSDKPRGAICEDTDSPYGTTLSDGSFPVPVERLIFTMANGTPARFDRDSLFPLLSATQQRGLMGRWCDDNADCDAPDALDPNNPTRQKGEAVIAWLLGDDTPDIDAGLLADDAFRERDTFLGDILSAGPLLVGPPRGVISDQDYPSWKNEDAQKTRKDMVYVGANDGMLHAFDADTLAEVFAYVPAAIYPRLSWLSDPAYGGGDVGKKAYVDGPLSSSDAFFDDAWHTVLVGGFGAGAQGVYALDITDPTPELATDVVLWEFTDATGNGDDDLYGRDMGYTIAPPAIVRIDDNLGDDTEPKWVVLVNNGYDNRDIDTEKGEDAGACADDGDLGNCTISQTGNAVLYVLDLGGADSTRIKARMDTGVGDLTTPNGLSEVSTLDVNGDLIADRAYAGDLFGNLWRFDLRDTTHPPKLMFSARDDFGNAQPITSRVVTYPHPNGGHMLLFGTGRFLNSGDKIDLSVQTFYGIWDDDGVSYSDAVERADLLEHAFLEEAAAEDQASGAIVSRGRTSTKTPVSLPDGDVRGWRIDLKLQDGDAEGERVVVAPQVRSNGRVVFVSMIPGDCCSAGGTSWINALDAIDGSRLDYTPFDYNLDGGLDAYDLLKLADGGTAIGSSIRVGAGNSSGIYSQPATMSLGGGQVQSIVSDSEGELVMLREFGAHGWRTWLQR
jgi:type IV pilus assembly protein PilY1